MRRHVSLTVVLILSGCGGSTAPLRPVAQEQLSVLQVQPKPKPTPTPTPKSKPKPRSTKEIERYLKTRPGRAAFMVRDLKTGETFGYHQHERFITASVMKVNILIGLLIQRKDLTDAQWSAASHMIRHSDNNAANELYRLAGQGPGMGRVDKRLGMKHTIPYPTVWGATQTCPDDQVKLLSNLTQKSSLSKPHQKRVLKLMETVTPSQRWGISAAARPGDKVANKNGWTPMRFQGSGWAVNSIGRITGHGHDYLIAVFSAEQPTMAAGIRTIERLAQLAVGEPH